MKRNPDEPLLGAVVQIASDAATRVIRTSHDPCL
jgi:hypothetical protein